MSWRTTQPLFAVLVLASYMVSLLALPGAGVLCYQADGNVVIEWACGPCTISSNDEVPNSASGRDATDVLTASCLDIPVTGNTENAPTTHSPDEQRSAVSKAVVSAVFFTHAEVCDLAARPSFASPMLLPSSDPRATLRTIILLV